MLEDTFKVASIARVAGVILLTVRVFRVSQENFSDKTCLEDATTFKRSIFTKDLFLINQRSDWHWLIYRLIQNLYYCLSLFICIVFLQLALLLILSLEIRRKVNPELVGCVLMPIAGGRWSHHCLYFNPSFLINPAACIRFG